MASQVLNGSSNPVYANNTGKNVRLRINFLQNPTTVSWGNNAAITVSASQPAPKEILLAPSEVFSATSGAYNIVIIKEDGT